MKRIILLCLFLAFMLLISGCRKKPTAAITRKRLTETTILVQAAKVGNIEMIKSLVSSGADVNTKTTLGFTPLHYAVRDYNVHLVKLIIAGGANINVKTKSGNTPLQLAQNKNYKEIVELLRKHGA